MKKINLKDVTFLIPICIESNSRKENLQIIIDYINKYFHTSIHILEVDSIKNISYSSAAKLKYRFIKSNKPIFHRTKINNILINSVESSTGILYDTDVIIPPDQILQSIKLIRNKKNYFSLPYDGRFLQIDYYNKNIFKKNIDINFLLEGTNLFTINTYNSVGGCFIFDVEEYRKCGLENEHIEGWGHDDAERIKRLQKFGYSIYRPRGPLYHLYHERNQNSWFFDNEKQKKSFEIYFNTCRISKLEMENEISSWPWVKVNKQTI